MDMMKLMKQAQEFKQKMASVQDELAQKVVTGSSGGGMVSATVNGHGELLGLSIEKDIVNPDDTQMLQDLVMAAVNDGLRKARDISKEEMEKITGGLNIPGMF